MSAAQTGEHALADAHGNEARSTKSESELVEELGQTKTHAMYIEKDEVNILSEEHRNYLIRRHGTLELNPVPGYGDAGPYNWPHWKVIYPCPPACIEPYADTSHLRFRK
jgi:hypothetical protein